MHRIRWALFLGLSLIAVCCNAQSYPVSWAEITGMTLNADNSMTKTDGASGWTGGAISFNRMEPNQDGWIEFMIVPSMGFSVVGFSDYRVEPGYDAILYGFFVHNNTTLYITESRQLTHLGSFSPGESLRIAREGSSVNYYRNGTLIRTRATNASLMLYADAATANQGSIVPPVITSMQSQMIITPSIVHPVFENGFVGSVTVDVSGGNETYNFNWSSEETTPSITNKAIGRYSVAITDAQDRLEEFNVFLGCDADWGDLENMSVNPDNTLTKTGGGTSWNGGAVSRNRIEANQDGWMSFATPAPSPNMMLGLSYYHPAPNYGQLKFAFYLNGASLHIMEDSQNVMNLGGFKSGEILTVSKEGGKIKYYRNGVVVRTRNVNPAEILYADMSVQTLGTVIPQVAMSHTSKMSLMPLYDFPSFDGHDGGIGVQASGGYPPYNYSWSTGETTSSVNNKSRGNYEVTVTDALGNSITRNYYLGYPIAWTNIVNATLNNTVLIKTTPINWDAGASSLNILPANTDGWFEFAWDESLSRYGIGFSVVEQGVLSSIDRGIFISQNGMVSFTGHPPILGTLERGDVVRLARVNGVIHLYRNGVHLHNNSYMHGALIIDFSILIGSSPVITASFDKQITVRPTFLFPTPHYSGRGISLQTEGGYEPYTVNWSSGEQTMNIDNKLKGTYTVTISDAANRSFTRTYMLGYPVTWTNVQNVTVNSDNTLHRATVAWDGGALSSNVLPPSEDGWVQFVVNNAHTQFVIGLSRYNTVSNLSSTEYGFYMNDQGWIYIFESGLAKGFVHHVKEGDVFKVVKEGSNVKYYHNDILVRTVALGSLENMYADISLGYGRSPVITTSFSKPSTTFYAISSGTWSDGSIWSLADGGPVAGSYPEEDDQAIVKGYTVQVTDRASCSSVVLEAESANTSLIVDGSNAVLNVKNIVKISGDMDISAKPVIVINGGKLEVDE